MYQTEWHGSLPARSHLFTDVDEIVEQASQGLQTSEESAARAS